MSTRTTRVTLDRFEGDYAILVADGAVETLTVPRSLLPDDLSEGCALTLVLSADEERTETTRQEVNDLMDTLIRRSEA